MYFHCYSGYCWWESLILRFDVTSHSHYVHTFALCCLTVWLKHLFSLWLSECLRRTLVKLCNGSKCEHVVSRLCKWISHVLIHACSDLRICSEKPGMGIWKQLSMPLSPQTHTTDIQSLRETPARPSEWAENKIEKYTPTETPAKLRVHFSLRRSESRRADCSNDSVPWCALHTRLLKTFMCREDNCETKHGLPSVRWCLFS